MPDVKIDTAKAAAWTAKVKDEIALTEATLKEVTEACKIPGQDGNDVIINCITVIGGTLTTAYDNVADAFTKAWTELENGLKEFSKVGKKISDNFDELNQMIKR